MPSFGFKKLTVENWLEPDPVMAAFVSISAASTVAPMSADDWAAQFLIPQLSATVPAEVAALFEVARSSIAYGYFFYPLFTLGGEQLLRVAEAAASAKCTQLNAPRSVRKFFEKIDYLQTQNTISQQEHTQWTALRKLRNIASHPQQQMILTPGNILSLLTNVATQINDLFK